MPVFGKPPTNDLLLEQQPIASSTVTLLAESLGTGYTYPTPLLSPFCSKTETFLGLLGDLHGRPTSWNWGCVLEVAVFLPSLNPDFVLDCCADYTAHTQPSTFCLT